MDEIALTTLDNPFNPFSDFTNWWLYDQACGYGTCEYLDKIAKTSDSFGDEMNRKIIRDAMYEIEQYDPLGIRKVITKAEADAKFGVND